MNNHLDSNVALFKARMEKVLAESSSAQATETYIRSLTTATLAALYDLTHVPVDHVEKPSQFVSFPEGRPQPSKRIGIDISEQLHATIKTVCAYRRTTMAEVVIALLENHFHKHP